MSNIKVFGSIHEFTPEQALLSAKNLLEEEEVEVFAWIAKVRHTEEDVTYPSCCTRASRAELSWLGRCLQLRAEDYSEEDY